MKQTTIDEIKAILKANGFNRAERRLWIRTHKREVKLQEDIGALRKLLREEFKR